MSSGKADILWIYTLSSNSYVVYLLNKRDGLMMRSTEMGYNRASAVIDF